jgi:hypothetical protein
MLSQFAVFFRYAVFLFQVFYIVGNLFLLVFKYLYSGGQFVIFFHRGGGFFLVAVLVRVSQQYLKLKKSIFQLRYLIFQLIDSFSQG